MAPTSAAYRRLLSRCILTLLGLISSAAIAHATALRIWKSGDWTMVAEVNDQTKAFDHCRAYRAIDTGGTFGVAQRSDFNWVLMFSSPTPYQLTPNTGVTVPVHMGATSINLGNTRVTGSTTLQFSPTSTSGIVDVLRGAPILTFEIPDGHRGSVSLAGLSRAMNEVTQCVQTQLAAQRPGGTTPVAGAQQPAQAAAAPQSQPAGQQPGAQPAAAAQFELAATRIASNLLLQSKLPNGHLLNPNEIPPMLKGLGAAWTSDVGFGSVMVVPPQPGKDVQHVALETIVGGANACKGEFAAGRSTSLVDDTLVTKAFTACSDSTGTHSLRYFILHRETSWFVVYAIVPPASVPNGGLSQADMPGPLQDSNFQAVAVKAALYQ